MAAGRRRIDSGRATKIIHIDSKERWDGDRPQIRRREQQTEHKEHDLRQPRQPVKVLQDPVAVANRPVAEQEAAQIHRQNTAAVQRRGDGKIIILPLSASSWIESRRGAR